MASSISAEETADGKALNDECYKVIGKCNEPRAKELISKNKGNIHVLEWKNSRGEAPLHRAAGNGHVEIFKLLISNGASLDFKDSNGWTPLHWAAANRRIEIIKLLISNGASLDVKNNSGDTPLHRAAVKGYFEIIKLLIYNGASLDVKDSDGRTPFDWADDFVKAEWNKLLADAALMVKLRGDGAAEIASHPARSIAEKAEKEEADRIATEKAAKAEADRIAAEKAAMAEAERIATEKTAKAEADRIAAEKAAKAEAERITAETAAKVGGATLKILVLSKLDHYAGTVASAGLTFVEIASIVINAHEVEKKLVAAGMKPLEFKQLKKSVNSLVDGEVLTMMLDEPKLDRNLIPAFFEVTNSLKCDVLIAKLATGEEFEDQLLGAGMLNMDVEILCDVISRMKLEPPASPSLPSSPHSIPASLTKTSGLAENTITLKGGMYRPDLGDSAKGGFHKVIFGVRVDAEGNVLEPVAFKLFPVNEDGQAAFHHEIDFYKLVMSLPADKKAQATTCLVRLVDNSTEGFTPTIKGQKMNVMVYEKADFDLRSLSVKAVLSEAEKLDLINKLAAAIQFLHSLRIAHTDMKPENIVIFKDVMGSRTVKLIDWDGWRKFGEPVRRSHSFAFTSREQMAWLLRKDDEEELGASAKLDVHSFASCVLFMLDRTYFNVLSEMETEGEKLEAIAVGKLFDRCVSELANERARRLLLDIATGKVNTMAQVMTRGFITGADMTGTSALGGLSKKVDKVHEKMVTKEYLDDSLAAATDKLAAGMDK